MLFGVKYRKKESMRLFLSIKMSTRQIKRVVQRAYSDYFKREKEENLEKM